MECKAYASLHSKHRSDHQPTMSRMQKDLANSAHAGSANEQDSDGDMLRRSLPPGRRLRVCVVGAGVAGLRAADTLARHGAEVTILEARNRIGGRVCGRALSRVVSEHQNRR